LFIFVTLLGYDVTEVFALWLTANVEASVLVAAGGHEGLPAKKF
jgi:hypothetical protein